VSNIIPLFQPREEKIPQSQGEAFCIQCGREWQAVAPVGTVQLECPDCKTMKGLFRFPFAPADGQLVRECDCGNQLFYLTPEGHMCANCGTYQSY
jgi:hypothetical protein